MTSAAGAPQSSRREGDQHNARVDALLAAARSLHDAVRPETAPMACADPRERDGT
jgi:hypothetical protein